MKQERLFQALTEIGDDLLVMAQTRTYVNPWKRWGKLAACIALVICLAAVSLPYFPMGCGAAEHAPATEEAPAMEESVVVEIPAEEAPAEEELAVEEEAPADTEMPTAEPELGEVVSVFFEGRRYELQPGLVEDPDDIGAEKGTVEESDGWDLRGCVIYAVVDSADIYVETPEGLRYCKLAEYQ